MNNFNKPYILIVDDESEVREVIVEILSEVDAKILEADSGTAALEMIEHYPVDLILTDISMSKMSGLELLEEVHNNYPDILTVIITGVGDRETVLKALQLHAYDFFEKPITSNILITKIKHILEACENKRLLKLALKEWVLERFPKLELSDFEKKSLIEQNEILNAALKIFKLKSLSEYR